MDGFDSLLQWVLIIEAKHLSRKRNKNEGLRLANKNLPKKYLADIAMLKLWNESDPQL